MEADALDEKLADRLAEVMVETLFKLCDIKTESLIDTLADRLAEMEMQTLSENQAEVAKALVDTGRQASKERDRDSL